MHLFFAFCGESRKANKSNVTSHLNSSFSNSFGCWLGYCGAGYNRQSKKAGERNMEKGVRFTSMSFMHIFIILIFTIYFISGVSPWRMVCILVSKLPALLLKSLQVSSPPPPAGSLKAAILNVTNDFSDLSSLIQEFIVTRSNDSNLETAFREFLDEKKAHSLRSLESSLDMLLTVYKIAFPFALLSMLSRISGQGKTSKIKNQPIHGV